MAVISVKMPTGWKPDMYTVDKLQQSTLLFLKRTEVDNNRPDLLNFYFDEFNRDKVCMEFDMIQDIEVKNLKPAHVSIYDYYEPEKIVQDFFEIGPDCNRSAASREKKPRKDQPIDNRTPEEIEFETVPKSMVLVRNLIDTTELPISTELTTDAPKMTQVKGTCPVCEDLSLKKLVKIICKSAVVYSAQVLKANRVRILRDFKPNKKTVIDFKTGFTIPNGCTCYLSNIKIRSKVLIIMEKDNLMEIKKNNVLNLDSKSTVLVLNKTVKKTIIAAKRSRYCRGSKPTKAGAKMKDAKKKKIST